MTDPNEGWTSLHVNSERETISIARATAAPFNGHPLLVILDDPPPRGTGRAAPMLLDPSTRRWLREQLDRLDTEEPH